MSDNTMPQRIYAGCAAHGNSWGVPGSVLVERLDDATEYIRADFAQAQLDAANARIAELESLCRTMQNLSDVHGLLHGNALARIAELEAEMHAIHFAAHMPEDYEHGLPSWINQHLYGKLVDWTDVDGLPIRRSEDVEHIIRQNRRIAELEAAQRWVSVDERLPKRNERVWVIGTGATYPQTAHYRYNTPSGAYWDIGSDLPLRHVTHWMPLPPPPTKNETEASHE